MPASAPLSGLRVLVPPSRLDKNPLVPMFGRVGAEVVTFPDLREARVDSAPLDATLERIGSFDWIVVAGGGSADHLFERLADRGLGAAALRGRVAAIGFSALKALRSHGVEPDVRPKEHYATGVADHLQPLSGTRVLLVRAEGATHHLPEELRRQGAEVEALTGHAVVAKADAGSARQALHRRLDLAAFANPATVRLFTAGLAQAGGTLDQCLGGVVLFAVGPTTADALAHAGIPADYVAAGRLKPLLDEVVALAGRP